VYLAERSWFLGLAVSCKKFIVRFC